MRQDAIHLRPASVALRDCASTTDTPPPPGARNRRYRHASPLSRAQAQPLLKSRAGTSARRQSISRRRRTILFIPMAVPTFACLAPRDASGARISSRKIEIKAKRSYGPTRINTRSVKSLSRNPPRLTPYLLRRVACCIGKARKKLCSWWVSRLSGTCAVLIRWPHVDLIISTGNQ
jgi:hypothetical protein